MEITKIEPCKKAKSRSNVYVDGEFAFSVYKDVVLEAKLYEGQRIDESFINKVKAFDEYNKALKKAYDLLAIRQRSQGEIEKKLREKGFKEAIIKKAVSKLKNKGYIDDDDFSKEYAIYLANKGYGMGVIRQKLREKGIENIDETIVSENQLIKNATDYGRKIFKRLKDDDKKKQKFVQSFLRHGYSYDMAKKVFELISKEDEGFENN